MLTLTIKPSLNKVIPDKIRDTYKNDYNILSIDEIIRLKIEKDKIILVPSLQLKLDHLNKLIKKPQTVNDRNNTSREIEKIQKQISDIENNEILLSYNQRVENLLMLYKNHKNMMKKISPISMNKVATSENPSIDKMRFLNIIAMYLKIAKDYLDIEVVRETEKEVELCENCYTSIEQLVASEKGIKLCLKCNCENIILLSNSIEIEPHTEFKNKGLDDFLFQFDCYNGAKIPEADLHIIITKLDSFFVIKKEEIRKLPLNRKRRRGNTNPKMLWAALSEIGYSKYYKYYTYIAHIYWDWGLPDAEKYRHRLIDIYTKTQNAYNLLSNNEKERKSNPGIQHRLYKSLDLAGHECWADEFRLPENEKSKNIADNLWRLMCNGANDETIRYH